MRKNGVSHKILDLFQAGKKSVALLIDPEKIGDASSLRQLILTGIDNQLGFFFVGGSLGSPKKTHHCVSFIKGLSQGIPVVLFPGNALQWTENSDALLFLSLISGRNPEFLIGQHVSIAPYLATTNIEVLPTGYMLVDSGGITSVNYISQTLPLPNDKPDLAIATALAGVFLGLKYLFLDAGSGANHPVSPELIAGVKKNAHCPLLVGGGIDTANKAQSAWEAGADIIVLGNGVEKNPGLLMETLNMANSHNLSLNVN